MKNITALTAAVLLASAGFVQAETAPAQPTVESLATQDTALPVPLLVGGGVALLAIVIAASDDDDDGGSPSTTSGPATTN